MYKTRVKPKSYPTHAHKVNTEQIGFELRLQRPYLLGECVVQSSVLVEELEEFFFSRGFLALSKTAKGGGTGAGWADLSKKFRVFRALLLQATAKVDRAAV